MLEKHLDKNWYVYLVRCCDGSLYTGIAKSLEKRLAEHNTDNQLGAKYTRSRRPVKLVYQERFTSRALAARRESAIKRLSKKQKEILVSSSVCPECAPKSKKFD
ncbi:GIY-YIG nuclease family protein [Kaarinaea lacus]